MITNNPSVYTAGLLIVLPLLFGRGTRWGYNKSFEKSSWDLCKKSPFDQFLRHTQILILKILNVWMPVPMCFSSGWLKSSSSSNLNKIEHFSKVSTFLPTLVRSFNSENRKLSKSQVITRPVRGREQIIPKSYIAFIGKVETEIFRKRAFLYGK